MKIVSISDTHIRHEGDAGECALFDFFHEEKVKNADMIVLVGDIFDFAAGFHLQYIKRFSRFFKEFKKCLMRGQKFVFVEGNHDLHLRKVFLRYIQEYNLNRDYFFYSCSHYDIWDCEKKITFVHGDEFPGSPQGYLQYKKQIKSTAASYLADLLPLCLFDFLANKASKQSRAKSQKIDKTYVQNLFRKRALAYMQDKNSDLLIFGHSHLVENWQERIYNVGFPAKSRQYFFSHNGEGRLEHF